MSKPCVRNVLAENGLTEEWKIRSLHQMTIALNQLHKISIAHQDLKPSNIVVTKKDVFKLTDLGSAYRLDGKDEQLPEHLNKIHSGTWEYLPPELLYGHVDENSIVRRIGCDVYLLGNMVSFYYTNMSMNSHLKNNLTDSLAWTNLLTQGNFAEIKPLLSDAFEEALIDIGRHIEDEFVKNKIITVIRYLCNPDPNLRGHAENIRLRGFNYSLNRIVTVFSELTRYQIIKNKKNGSNL